MAGTIQSMTAQTERMLKGRQPSRRALATRSLTAADRLTGEARAQALREHFDRFVPSLHRSCPAKRLG